jgi:hypothetical protein
MKKILVTLFVVAVVVGVMGLGSVYALNLDLGTNITIWDKWGDNTTTGWHRGTNDGNIYEDEEVEPPDATGQQWDLEAFYLKGTKLSMVGGFNFIDGEDDPHRPGNHYDSGDIFLDVTGGTNPSGYDYVLDLDFDALTYTVYSLMENSVFQNVYFSENAASNPWRYVSGGTQVGQQHSTSYATYSQDINGLQGGSHNVAAFDLSFLMGQNFTAHFTMECGNDNLMGSGDVVPEPTTLLLLGFGLIGLFGLERKYFRK